VTSGNVTQACVFVSAEKMSDRLVEQHINIKFCAQFDKSSSETLQMLTEAYGADAMKKSSVFVSLSGIKGLKMVGKT
jgi:hypothetical protein